MALHLRPQGDFKSSSPHSSSPEAGERPLLPSFIPHLAQGEARTPRRRRPLPAPPLPSRPARARTQTSRCPLCGLAVFGRSQLHRAHLAREPRGGPDHRPRPPAPPAPAPARRSCPRLGLPRLASVPSALDCARTPRSAARSLARARPAAPVPRPPPLLPAPPAPPPPPVQLLPKPPHTAMLS